MSVTAPGWVDDRGRVAAQSIALKANHSPSQAINPAESRLGWFAFAIGRMCIDAFLSRGYQGFERVFEVIRRTKVVGFFPDAHAIVRLVGAILLKQNDEWAVQRAPT